MPLMQMICICAISLPRPLLANFKQSQLHLKSISRCFLQNCGHKESVLLSPGLCLLEIVNRYLAQTGLQKHPGLRSLRISLETITYSNPKWVVIGILLFRSKYISVHDQARELMNVFIRYSNESRTSHRNILAFSPSSTA